MDIFLIAILSYLSGSIPFGLLLSKTFGKIDIRKIGTNKVNSFELDGHKPSFVDMPIWYTHRITNVGDEDLYTIFWINEEFNSADPDTYYEEI